MTQLKAIEQSKARIKISTHTQMDTHIHSHTHFSRDALKPAGRVCEEYK